MIYDYPDALKVNDDKAKNVNYMFYKDYINVYEKHPDFKFEDEGFYKRISDSITKGQRLMLQPTYCGAPSNSYLLDPYRNIYACWERIGENRWSGNTVRTESNSSLTLRKSISIMYMRRKTVQSANSFSYAVVVAHLKLRHITVNL